MAWDPKIYLSFGPERTRPAAELLARVAIEAPARVADLGCGPGNSTALLRARWPQA
jgi:trans-aconitate 2-methyltransferase